MRFIVLIIAIFTSLYSSSIVSGSFHKMKTLQSSKGYKIVELNNIPYTEYVNNKLIFKATTGDIVFYYLKNQDRKQTNDGVTYNIKSYAYCKKRTKSDTSAGLIRTPMLILIGQ